MVHHLRTLLKAIDVAFCKLHRIQFSAPWATRPRGC